RSSERCTYGGACACETGRTVDYRAAGAKGSGHRGEQVSRWAELVVPRADGDALPEWETRTWRRIRTEVAARRAARLPVARATRAADPAPLPVPLRRPAPAPPPPPPHAPPPHPPPPPPP